MGSGDVSRNASLVENPIQNAFIVIIAIHASVSFCKIDLKTVLIANTYFRKSSTSTFPFGENIALPLISAKIRGISPDF